MGAIMNYQSFSDDQLKDNITRLRDELATIKQKLEKGDKSIEYNTLRTKMSDLNLLKIEARKRRLEDEIEVF
jgi:hypothetical protein